MFNKLNQYLYTIDQNWSIGIFSGRSPFELQPVNNGLPVLTAKDINDIPAVFVADPFLIKEKNKYYLFFEVMNAKTYKGEIAYASSDNGINWNYEKIILSHKYHLSYPYIFNSNNEFFMIPESAYDFSIRLYKAIKFPTKWRYLKKILSGRYLDSSIIYYNNYWYLFTAKSNDKLELYFSENLEDKWFRHPKSPIIENNPHIARPAGRILFFNEKIYRFAQDSFPLYGSQVFAIEITELTSKTYQEKLISQEAILKPGELGWNKLGMHTFNPIQIGENKWLAAVDGWSNKIKYKNPIIKRVFFSMMLRLKSYKNQLT